MKQKTRIKIVNYLPCILFSVPVMVILYAKFGNPSERFFEIANTVSLYIVFTPIFLFLFTILYFTISGAFEKMDDKCKCCCKCFCKNYHCCKGES